MAPDSAYQQALIKLQEAKATYISLRASLATVTGEDRAALEAELAEAEAMYNQAQEYLDQITAEANSAISFLTGELDKANEQLLKVEETLFNFDIEATLQNKLAEIDASANAAKDAFFADFEAKYGADINRFVENLTATKKTIVSAIDETTADIRAKRDELAGKFDEKYGDYIDFIAKKIHCEFGDEMYYAEQYMKDAIDSAKQQLIEKLESLPLPELS